MNKIEEEKTGKSSCGKKKLATVETNRLFSQWFMLQLQRGSNDSKYRNVTNVQRNEH